MSARDTLAALIERVEQATGPDRDIDFAVAAAVGWPDSPHSHQHARRYTEHLDAAVSLVPTKPVPNLRPGQWWWMLEAWPDEVKASVHYENGDSGIIEESAAAATPALALTAAALRARMESTDDQ